MNGYTIDGELVHPMKEKWDFFIILDACRYDCFKEVYQDIIPQGTLKKAISPATWTMEWLEKIFTEKYDDTIYISGNPFVNSFKHVTYKGKYGQVANFCGKDRFHLVIDAWKTGWSSKLGGMPPQGVNKAFFKTYMMLPKKRYILHYMQPHRPYITEGGMPNRTPGVMKAVGDAVSKQKALSQNTILKKLFMQIPERQAWEIKKMLYLPLNSAAERIYRAEGKEGIFRIYKNEIKYALEHINHLLESISGKWIITADHGERLCDWWWYNHAGKKRGKDIIEVPWLEMKT